MSADVREEVDIHCTDELPVDLVKALACGAAKSVVAALDDPPEPQGQP